MMKDKRPQVDTRYASQTYHQSSDRQVKEVPSPS